ncbi:MAG: hypothetical protein IKZ64_01620 [Alphaproteobacteria bacterium]|nr:hypothetical protein [Alphaproteobacteria bacterium]
MGRIILLLFLAICTAVTNATAATGRLSKYIDPQSYSYMYPYLSNKMRTELNPGTTVTQTNNPMDVVVRTKSMDSNKRRVVSRTNSARATTATATKATTGTAKRRVVQRNTTARAATTTSARKVVSRRARTTDRYDPNANVQTAGNTTLISNEGVSSSRCLADYTECMNGYCEHADMAYNRCFCSARLTQIDAKYQKPINDLITRIIQIQSVGTWTEEEMNEYWMERIGNYVGENSWVNLENALNIEWPTNDDRVRGQNAFLTGHQYCVQHLRNCGYMASNLRDAYRSKITRDCDTYENSLLKVKTAAESLIQYYSE